MKHIYNTFQYNTSFSAMSPKNSLSSFIVFNIYRFIALFVLLCFVVLAQATTYYSKGSLAPNTNTNWSSTTDGTGGSPSAFTNASDIFVIQNGHTMTQGASWTVTGSVIINSTGSLVQTRNFTATGGLTVSGSITFGSSKSTNNRAMSFGDVTLNSGAVWTEPSSGSNGYNNTYAFTGSFTNNAKTFTAVGAGIHTFSGTSKTISGSTTTSIPSITLSGTYTNSGTITAGTALVVSGTLTNNGTVTATTALSGAGTLSQGTNATLNIGGTNTITTLTANTANGNTVNYTGAAQAAKVTTYNNLTLSGSLAKTFATAPTVNGVLSMEGTATMTITSGTLIYGTNATLQYNTSTVRSAGAEWPATFSGTGGVIIQNTGAISLNEAKTLSNNVNLTIVSGATLYTTTTYYGLNLGGDLKIAGGTLKANLTTNNAGAITINGTSNPQTIDAFTTTGTVTIGGTAAQSIAGITSGAISMIKTGGTATFTGNVSASSLTVDGVGGTLDFGAGLNHTFSGNVTLTNGILYGNTSTINANSSTTAWGGTGSVFSPGSSTVVFGGGGAQTISVTSPAFYNVTFTGPGTKTMSNAFTATNVMTVNGSTPAVVQLPNISSSTVHMLKLGTSYQAFGSYGSTASSATTKNSTYFGITSTGIINAQVGNRFVVTGSSSQTAGASQTLTIKAVDPNGTTLASYTGSHNLTFSGANPSPNSTNPIAGGVAFGSSTAVTFTSGSATVSATLFKVETALISVSDGTYSSGGTENLTVNVTTTYVQTFSTQPGGGLVDAVWSQQPKVTIQDGYGNLNTGTARNITLAISSNAGPGGVLSGTTTEAVNTSTAQATFTDLSINLSGSGYTLKSSISGFSDITSNSFNISNPTPTISGISPTSVCAGSPDQTVVVTGTNFNSISVVQLGGTSKTTTFVSSTEVHVLIPAADLVNGGTPSIAVYNPAPGGGTSSGATLTVSKVVITPTVVQPSCYAYGRISIAASGGTAPYTYDWDDISGTNNAQNREGLQAGSYRVTVTDANGCSTTSSTYVLTAASGCTGISVCKSDAASVLSVPPDVNNTSYTWTVPTGAVINSGQGTSSISVDWRGVATGAYQVSVVANNSSCGTSSQSYIPVYVQAPTVLAYADLACSGSNLYLYAQGGSSYSWTGPNSYTSHIANPVISNATSTQNGTYTVTVTNDAGCSATSTVSVTVNTPPSVSGEVLTSPSPTGSATGSITLTTVSGGSGFTFQWSSQSTGFSSTTQNPTNLSADVYTVVITNSTGCTTTKTYALNDFTVSVSVSTPPANVKCNGGTDGTITLNSPSGGASPYTYDWTGPNGFTATTQSLTGLAAGIYDVVVTDVNGLQAGASATITEPTVIQADGAITNINCYGSSTGGITQTVTGGTVTTGYTYAWTKSGGGFTATTKDISSRPAGTYYVIISDNASPSCTLSKTYVITEPSAAISASSTVTPVKCYGDNTGQIVLSVSGGTSPYTYSWSKSGGGFSATTKDISGCAAGTYSVTIIDAKGCTYPLSNILIAQPTAVLAANTGTPTNVSCNGGSNGAITLTVTGGTTPYTYAWSNGATSKDLSGLTAGTYSVTVTDANSCTVTPASVTITQPNILTASAVATNVLCNGSSTGSIALTVGGGTGTKTYLWSNAATTQNLSNVPAGYYSVTVTDANGCTAQANATVTQPSLLEVTATVTNVLCHGDGTGAINITASGGSGSYTYDWYDIPGTSNSQNRSGLVAGSYTLKVTDSNGCENQNTYIITQPSVLSLTAINSNVSCHGNTDGSINLTVSGSVSPYTYSWSKSGGGFSASTEDISGLVAGTYSVTVTDANNCTATLTPPAITEPGVLSVVVSLVNNVSCKNGANGSATATPSGGTAPFLYTWSNGSTSQTPTNFVAGNYNVTVVDSKGCSASGSISITEPDVLELFATTRNTSACGGSSGAIDLTVVGGSTPYTYLWSNSYTGQDPTGLAAGSYNVTVTDNNGCTATLSGITIAGAPTLSVTFTVVKSSCLYSSGTVYAVVNGGVQPYSYAWTKNGGAYGGNTSAITGLDPDNYAVTVTDADGCTATSSTTVTATVCNPPVAVADNFNSFVGTPVIGSAATNDYDPDNTLSELTFLPLNLPTNKQGTLVWDNSFNGSFTFNPTPGFSGTVQIRYRVEDPTGLQSDGIITINVYPTPLNDINTTFKNRPVSGNVMTNDLFEDNVPLAVTSVTKATAQGGTVTINTDGTYSYMPPVGYIGGDSFNYEVCNTVGFCATADVNIEVLPLPVPSGNNPPVANPDAYSMFSNSTLNGNVISNDFDVDGNLNMTSITLLPGSTAAAHGTLTVNADGTFTFLPTAGYTGSVTFTYQVCDSGTPALCDQADVKIDIMAETTTNFTFATDDAFNGTEDTPITGNLVTNDYDPQGNTQTVNSTPVVSPSHGKVTLNSNGTFTYIPNANFSGTDQFVYKICDNGTPTACDQATVYLSVMPANDPPIAINDINTTFINTAVSGNVITNDTDPEGGTLTVNTTPVVSPSHGGVTLHADGTYTYTPTTGFTGQDSFTYSVCDNGSPQQCDQATVTINVMALATTANNPPVANDDAYKGNVNATVSGNVISNDFDVDGNLNVSSVIIQGSAPNPVTQGTLTLHTDGTFTFVPITDFVGQVTFTYRVYDLAGLYDDALVTIDINNKYANSVYGIDDYQITPLNTVKNGNVLTNDYDPDGNNMSVSNTGTHSTAHGSITINANGTYTYTPTTGYIGDDSFVYTVCDDGTLQACDNATLTITTMPASSYGNDAPVAVNDAFIGTINTTVAGNVISNDYDVDGNLDNTSVTIVGSPPNTSTQGTLTLNANGTFNFVPVTGFTGQVTFTYKVCDTEATCDQAVVTIDILAGNSTFAADDAYIGKAGTIISGNVKSNDYDPQGNTQTVNTTPVSGPAHGVVVLNSNGTFTFTPTAGYTGTDQFVYELCDNGTPQACDRATVYLNVEAINIAPVAVNDINSTFINIPVDGQVLTNDSDPDGGTLTVNTTPVVSPLHGSLTLRADGTYTYTPTMDYTGTDSFEYSVCDNGTPQKCDQATVALTVMPLPISGNNAPVANDDSYKGSINKRVSGNVISNDFDIDGNLNMTSVTLISGGTAATNGTLVLNADGTFTYDPNNGYTGKVTFTYQVCDSGTPALCDQATVTISITNNFANNTYALNDAKITNINTAVSGNVLSNDYDPQNNSMTVSSPGTYSTTHGSITIDAYGNYTYTSTGGYTGDDSYNYTMCDNGTPQACDNAVLVITVMPAPTTGNNPPVAVNDAFIGAINTTVTGAVLGNDYDVDGNLNTTSVTLIGGSPNPVTQGTLTLNANGTFSFVPVTGFTGQVTFTYQVCDTEATCDQAVVTIDILAGNSTFAADDAYIGKAGTIISGNVKSNDYDPQGDTQTVNTTPVSGPAHGNVVLNSNGTFTYTSEVSFRGTDQFVYQLCDNGTPQACDRATVYLTVNSTFTFKSCVISNKNVTPKLK